jgi:hypothetical protein
VAVLVGTGFLGVLVVAAVLVALAVSRITKTER